MKLTYIRGKLQIDHKRGVIYFHSDLGEMEQFNRCPTPLRICGLGEIEYPFDNKQVDITIKPASGNSIAAVAK